MRKVGELPTRGVRAIFWDTNKDHKAHRFDTKAGFLRAIRSAHLSGKPFRIAYTGPGGDPEFFEHVCCAVWSVLDGNKLTYFVAEEYGAACEGPGIIDIKRQPYHKRLWTEGRKYGLVWIATSQRPQNISKDSLENTGVIWAGDMGFRAAKRVGEEIDCDPRALRELKPGVFMRWCIGGKSEVRHVFTPISEPN